MHVGIWRILAEDEMSEALTMSGSRENVEDKCKFVQDVSALVIRHFRKGCLCSVRSRTFALLVARAFEVIDGVDGDTDVKSLSKTLLSFLSCLRTLVRTLVQLDNFEGDEEGSSSDGTLCKHFYEWILILVNTTAQHISNYVSFKSRRQPNPLVMSKMAFH